MFLQSFSVTAVGISQILLLGAVGYFLMKNDFLGDTCLITISRLSMEITLPAMIFCQLTRDFSFSAYPHWWAFPVMSIVVTVIGLVVGGMFLGFFKGRQHKMQFLSLIAFQNSGFLPIALVAALLPAQQVNTMFIYLFLFLLGFNLVMFSLGVYLLTFSKETKFEIQSLLSVPVLATILSLFLVAGGMGKSVPEFIYKSLKMLGDCTIPLAMLVVGGNLAQIRAHHIRKRAMALVSLAKLVILPLVGLGICAFFKLPHLVGLLFVLQLAVPSAVTSSVIVRQYDKEDILLSQGIFVTHVLSIITIPVFLSLYFTLCMLQ
ncbi:MAG TPA: AEC family transporter [Candidatus Omnitrophota bacterium]|nr:AEC family transporter [Candidatus Omnitrophota bacterium]HPT07329.1 AEC family transporter [Candidatus Omnitrophota bacterium]